MIHSIGYLEVISAIKHKDTLTVYGRITSLVNKGA